MSNAHNKKIDIGSGAGLLGWVYLFIALSTLEFLLVGVIAWKWGQKQTWTKNKGINGVLAVIAAMALVIVSDAVIGSTTSVFGKSPYWSDHYISGMLFVNILLIGIGAVIFLIWLVRWLFWTVQGLFKPPEQEEPQSPKEWISNYLRN